MLDGVNYPLSSLPNDMDNNNWWIRGVIEYCTDKHNYLVKKKKTLLLPDLTCLLKHFYPDIPSWTKKRKYVAKPPP